MTTAIWWVRRDQRLHDNDALHAALETCDTVVPVFILDPALLTASDVMRRVAFMLGGLAALDADLRRPQHRSSCAEMPPAESCLGWLWRPAAVIHAEADPWPMAGAAMPPLPPRCPCASLQASPSGRRMLS